LRPGERRRRRKRRRRGGGEMGEGAGAVADVSSLMKTPRGLVASALQHELRQLAAIGGIPHARASISALESAPGEGGGGEIETGMGTEKRRDRVT
jgi:hypothetical protein